MAASRDLSSLRRPSELKAHEWRKACSEDGVEVLVYCTYRGETEQAALYAQGRMGLPDVNRLRVLAGIPPITEKENRSIVTFAGPGESMHQYCLAWDACPVVAGKLVWDSADANWQIMAEHAEQLGIEWGGTWSGRKKESPHFQYLGGLTTAAVRAGHSPA